MTARIARRGIYALAVIAAAAAIAITVVALALPGARRDERSPRSSRRRHRPGGRT
jgi:hypothetical protein